MTRPPRQSDIVRAIRAAQSTGVTVARIEVTQDGRIVIIAADRQVEGRSIKSLSKLRKELQRQAVNGDVPLFMSASMSGSD